MVRILYLTSDGRSPIPDPQALERELEGWTVTTAETATAGKREFATTEIACVLVPAALPDADGIGFLASIRDTAPDVPILLYATDESADLAAEAFAAGATDCLQRATGTFNTETIAARISNYVDAATARDGTDHFEELLNAVGDPIHTLDEHGRFTFVNEAYSDLLGYDRAELVGTAVEDVLADDEYRTSEEAVATLLSDDNDIEHVINEVTAETNDGEELIVQDNISLLPTDDGEYRGVCGVVRDVTEKRKYERQLERFAAMADAAADMTYTLDRDGRFEFVNTAAAEVTGYSREELIGSHVSLIMSEADIARGRELVRDILTDPEQATMSLEWTMYQRDGGTIECESHIRPLFSDGTFAGTTGIVRDITDKLARKEELERQNERLEEFAEIVSHDIRSPLSVAQTRLDLAASAGDSGGHLPHAQHALNRIEAIIEDSLQFARQGQSVTDVEEVALEDCARESWHIAAGGDATLDITASATIKADRTRLKQVLENLFANAVDHVGEDVAVKIGLLPDRDGFYVADDGPGIPDESKTDVFTRGHTTSESGTGFGLSIVEQLVTAHGWDVTLTEAADGGARFVVSGVDFVTDRTPLCGEH